MSTTAGGVPHQPRQPQPDQPRPDQPQPRQPRQPQPRQPNLPRLSPQALALTSPQSWTPPPQRPRTVGIVHLGLGAFHRAHQSVFTEDAAMAAGEDRWGICGVSQRSAAVIDQLLPQQGLYSLLERGTGAAPLRVVGTITELAFAGSSDHDVPGAIADPEVAVVTLTVTEKGYRRNNQGGLDLEDPAVTADLADPPERARAPRTVIGQIVRGLQRRYLATGSPLTIISCDNVTGNGNVLRHLVNQFCDALPGRQSAALLPWIEESVRFPSTMVDRIAPATTAADRDEVAHALGMIDSACVVTEPFRQWVIEDSFAGPRPKWELAGATLTDEVAPWESSKIRVLNAAHSTLAYLGALRGYRTIAQAVQDHELAQAAWALIHQDAVPTLSPPPGLDLASYAAAVMERFANPALRHTTVQIAMDGSQKLPVRLLGIVRDRLAQGAEPTWSALGVAAWMTYVSRAVNGPQPDSLTLILEDPMAPRLAKAVSGRSSPADIVSGLLDIEAVFGADLAGSDTFRHLLVDHVAHLMNQREGNTP